MNEKFEIILLIEVYILYIAVMAYIVLFRVPFPGNIIVGVLSLNFAGLIGWIIFEQIKDWF